MEKITELFLKRDETAIEIAEKEYGGICRKIIGGFLNCAADAEEAMNDLWISIWNSIPPACPKYFKAYLAKAARNTALHYIERESAEKRGGTNVLIEELTECVPDNYFTDVAETVGVKDMLNRFLRLLKSEERTFFIRRYYFGETVSEIAAASKCSQDKVSVSLFRTREKLRRFLEKEEYTL